MKTNKPVSTFDKMMQNPDFKAKFEAAYQEFLLSELLIEIMENDHRSLNIVSTINFSLVSRASDGSKLITGNR